MCTQSFGWNGEEISAWYIENSKKVPKHFVRYVNTFPENVTIFDIEKYFEQKIIKIK